MTTNIRFSTVDLTAEAIDRLDHEWSALAGSAIEKNVFLFPWFVRAALVLIEERKPFALCVYDQEKLIGLTVLQSDRGYAKVPVKFYRNCTHYHQFLATPLIREGYAEPFFKGMAKWLDDSGKNFCLLNLLSGDGEIAQAAKEAFKDRSTALIDEISRAAIFGPVPKDSGQESHISKSRLKSLKRRRKQLNALGNVTVETFSGADDAMMWLDDFMRLEDSGWKGEGETSIAKNPPDIALYKQMIAGADAQGALNFMRLCLDGKPIACTLDLISGQNVYCLKSAHDAAYRKYAPGVILEHETLKRYYREDTDFNVDSCTSPDNEMINALWPHQRKVIALAIARSGIKNEVALKSVLFLKGLIGKNSSSKAMSKQVENNA